jgi:hypothetical protein
VRVGGGFPRRTDRLVRKWRSESRGERARASDIWELRARMLAGCVCVRMAEWECGEVVEEKGNGFQGERIRNRTDAVGSSKMPCHYHARVEDT